MKWAILLLFMFPYNYHICCTLPGKLFKSSQKNSILQPGPDSPFHLFICVKQMLTKLFLQFWEKMEVKWHQIWIVSWRGQDDVIQLCSCPLGSSWWMRLSVIMCSRIFFLISKFCLMAVSEFCVFYYLNW